ncbi:mannitol dehydrogenase family protein [Azospirillum agricola]|uniref:mannitol dehydrogenase family protein n=1 Tax=Azospirillum agricola TaxID=1720247 RepID=UPI000A0F10E7|nr:D-mannonate oxidoreductase [Azospirillum agricola]SMH45993.1 tagaturonate reductase [Azospirillum lipoferum]
MTGRILQFGTSRFLQAHVDLFVHEAREAGQPVGPIAVVQASGSAERAGRVAAFGRPGGFPVIIRGIERGAPVERRIQVTSVDRGLAAARDWEELSALFAGETDVVVSNMGDTGYEVAAADRHPALLSGTAVPHSFPGKLLALLHRRWRDGGRPLTILPCELVSRNGEVLAAILAGLARDAGAPAGFLGWLAGSVIIGNTLVDRIVSQPLEPIGAVAEPYALWAIERRPGLPAPCGHPAIVMTDDLEPFERLKLHILNLGHSVLADLWMAERRDPDETVRAILADGRVRDRLESLYRTEVVPGFAARGMAGEAEAYVATTLDRFLNPFLDHRIADIAQNHPAKVEKRIGAFLAWVYGAGSARHATPLLDAVLARPAEGIRS